MKKIRKIRILDLWCRRTSSQYQCDDTFLLSL